MGLQDKGSPMMSDRPVQNHMTTIFTEPLILLMALVFFFISLLNHQFQMTILILLVLGLMGVTKAWSWFSFSKMAFDLKIDKHKVFPGEKIRVQIQARNNKLLPVQLQVKVMMDESLLVSDTPACENSFLLWFQKTNFSWNFTAMHRGCFNIGHSQIRASDLFGFFPRLKIFQESEDVIVYPNIVPIRPVSMPEHYFFGVPGAKSPVQDPVYILGTREYQSFTPVKRIHWKASARYDKLQEKVCEPSVQEKILIVVDVDLFSARHAKDAFEHMLEAAASMAVHFEGRGNAVGFMTNAVIKGERPGFVPISRNRQTLSKILETIARMDMRPGNRLSDIFHRQIAVLWGINCIFCSHGLDSSIVKMKQFYAHKRIPVKYFVSTMAETEDGNAFIPGTIQLIDSICV